MAHVIDECVEIKKLEKTCEMLVHLAKKASQG
jgi:di/tripeptidase